MRIIKAYGVISLLFLIGSMCQASNSEFAPVYPDARELRRATSKKPASSLPSDEEVLGDGGASASSTSDDEPLTKPSPAAALNPSVYDVDAVILAIQSSTKSFYTNNHLSVDGDIFSAIRDGDTRMTDLFGTALGKFKKPEGMSWYCWPVKSKDGSRIRIHISNPK